ncbi:MAG TPA: hypothetical protein PLO64_01870 [Methanothermobacter sp.]|nr:conserved hypothetical protein [Methanothermobacter sp. MT-2]HHW05514.1 hypothetical protein [Methanothermobacter sp.]HOK72615.1 hypothetical protein [Methanothermobacter sp.]HOL68665.1 hypothetical protein [Methanothermobacter sp.]HPQ04424.1 hypothetical protein [Methanothermobacter sp.]
MKIKWRVKLGIVLLLSSAIIYLLVYIIFKDAKHELFYIGIDLAFLPLEILIVALVVEAAINAREKAILLEKLNMVIGAFFSEVGTEFLEKVSKHELNTERIAEDLKISQGWDEKKFEKVAGKIKAYTPRIPLGADKTLFLDDLRGFLGERRKFMIRLLENPNLLEHESFTDMLWAIFHLTEELEKRISFDSLPGTDYRHLEGDLERAYRRVVFEWLKYMEHLMKNYPYLFSLAIRTNPFDPEASIYVI